MSIVTGASIPFYSMHRHQKNLLTLILFLIILCLGASYTFQVLKESPETADASASNPDCAICGMSDNNQLRLYSQFQSIGIINLSTFDIYDTQIRIFDENGTEILNQEGVQFGYCSFGAEYGYAHISSMPSRGIADIDITYGESDEIDFEFLEGNLCPACLEKITVCCRNAGESKCRNIFLINFQTMDFYALPENLISFMQNDYYFYTDHFDNKDKVLIAYVPERKTD